ncbi:MAG: hypothetical protein RLZZ519_1796 [Bacteroidota bacterium]|jgi:hypothetical protein
MATSPCQRANPHQRQRHDRHAYPFSFFIPFHYFSPMNEDNDEIRFDNELKRLKLQMETGMTFSKTDSNLPPEIEGQFLDYISNFERAYQNAVQTTVGAFLGNPTWRPVAEISDQEMGEALDAALEILYEKNIKLNVLYDVEEREVYRFLTEELMDVEIDDMQVPGMFTNFIYEEFHPNDLEDARLQAESFLRCFLHESKELDWKSEVTTEMRNNSHFTGFHEGFDAFRDVKLQVSNIHLEGDRATATFEGSFKAMLSREALAFSGTGCIELVKEDEWWLVSGLTLPSSKHP